MTEKIQSYVRFAFWAAVVLCVINAGPGIVEWTNTNGQNQHWLMQIILFVLFIPASIAALLSVAYLNIAYTFLPMLGDKADINYGPIDGIAFSHMLFWGVAAVVLKLAHNPDNTTSAFGSVLAIFSSTKQTFGDDIAQELPLTAGEREKEKERVRKAEQLEKILADNKIKEARIKSRQDPDA
ncbi:hypothetical protein A8B75_00990 [Sphingomonadales bacterium EhC05]|nr:hypothetical protein A8B75_00990 [Sphingomonadales bacterium EhC05]